MRVGMWVLGEVPMRKFGEVKGDTEILEVTTEGGFTRHIGWIRERGDAEWLVRCVNEATLRKGDGDVRY